MDKSSSELWRLPFVRVAPAMAAGLLLAYFGGSAVCAIVFVCAAAFAVYSAVTKKRRTNLMLCALGLAAGLLSMGTYVHLYREPVLKYSGKTLRAEFEVREITSLSGDSERITAAITLNGIPTKVSLSCESALAVGQRAVADIELGEYDEVRMLYNLANGILLSGSAENLEILPSKSADGVLLIINTLRNELIGGIERVFYGDERALVTAMLFGEDSKLSQSAKEQLRICGAAHFTAVSGSHFAIFGAVLTMLIPKKRKLLKALFPLVFAPLSIMFFGTGASVIRAALMFFLGGAAMLFRRKGDPLNTLCAAFSVIAFVSPAMILDVGFIMSVLGVFGVAAVGVRLSERISDKLFSGERFPKKAVPFLKAPITLLAASISAVVCTAPVSVAVFKGMSLFGAISSILLAALITVGAPFAVAAAITGSPLIGVPAAYLLRIANSFIEFFGSGKFRVLWLPLNFKGAWILAALAALMLVIIAYAPAKTIKPSAGCMAALMVFSAGMSLYTVDNQYEIRFLGNSQSGCAIVLSENTASVLISGSGCRLAGKLSQTLREQGIIKIKQLTACDADFTGALAIKELSELIEIEEIRSTPTAAAVLSERNIELITDKDSVLNVGGITIAAVSLDETDINADIAVYHGSFSKTPESTARLAVFFSSFERELPENGVNALREEIVVKIIDD